MTSLGQELTEFNELCRICANKTNGLLALNIFGGDDGTNKDIFKKINDCLPIQIELGDKLPKLICGECVCKLDLLNEFRDISRRTEAFLSDLLNRIFEHNVQPLLDVEYTSLVSDHTVTLEQVLDEQDKLHEASDMKSCEYSPVDSPLDSTEVNDSLDLKTESADGKVESITIDGSTYIVTSEPLEGNTYLICILCSKTFVDRNSFDAHCAETHWNKCEACSLLFTSQEAYAIHCAEIHPHNKQEMMRTDSNFIISHMESYRNLPQQTVPDAPVLSNGTIIGAAMTTPFSDDEELILPEDNKIDSMNENNLNEEDMESNEVFQDDNTTCDNDETCETEEKTTHIPRKEQGKSLYKCTVCHKYLPSQALYKTHKANKCIDKPYQCFKCDKRFRSKIGKQQHEGSHTGEFNYECDSCGKGFQCKSYLIVHQRVHSKEKNFHCNQCDMKFKSKQSLLDHVNRHMGVKPYTCNICGRGFITKALCRSHEKVHTGVDNRQHPCPICKKLFASKSYLSTHIRIHTGDKPHICEYCSKGFLTKLDLKIHSTLHTGVKSFVCETCGKAFARRDALRCHIRKHTGERPYSCNICGQTFTQFTPMTIHKRLHTGEKPYACSVCSEEFVSRSAQLAHEKRNHQS